ncbi:MAG: hypothetical protein K9G61_02195, partial [Bacteroidales bacterium]|nr:hypothetical protein [Bacteroidales bacterium]
AISAHQATRQIVQNVRMFTGTAYIIVRTRYLREVDELTKLGADEVIPEEFETSIEIFSHVLKKYLVAQDEIDSFICEIRNRNYEMLRNLPSAINLMDGTRIQIPYMEIVTLPVKQGNNKIVGKTISNSEIRAQFSTTILAIKRDEHFITEINPEEKILQDDILYLFGSPENIIKLNKHLKI